METYIAESLATGLIHPSSSPVGAGFFFVEKKDGPCIDYRGLNSITVPTATNRFCLQLSPPGDHFL